MTIPILVYTHSEYSFLWKAAIPLLERYAKDFQVVWCCDSLLDFKVPLNWRVYTYDPSLSWGYRVKGCLETIESDYVLYIQEDMLLIDSMSIERIEHCIDFMKEVKCEFLMSYPWNNRDGNYLSDKYEEYVFVKIFSHYFQPGIWKKSLLHEICSLNISLKENESEICFNITKDRKCYGVFHLKNDNQLSIRSFFFPHIHSIFAGKWTFFKYPCLKALVEAYGIDTTTRGVDTTWTVDYQ